MTSLDESTFDTHGEYPAIPPAPDAGTAEMWQANRPDDVRCDTCAMWVQKYAAMGECMLPWVGDSGVRFDDLKGCDELPTLLTPGYHHCAGYQRKDGQP